MRIAFHGVHDDLPLGLPSAGDLLLRDRDAYLHCLGSHHDLRQVVNMLSVEIADDLHSGHKPVVYQVKGFYSLLECFHYNRSYVPDLHVKHRACHLFEVEVRRKHLSSYGLGSAYVLQFGVISPKDRSVVDFCVAHFSILSQATGPSEECQSP
ncbi:hypothetical protein SDC9_191634 [bioreactor metagenome]|uniref:Uncharacterized protein n=1 Tax=bioreactor metagenome TaxID=1076179 RepID=A0A645I9H5_9ZZZZ